MTAAMVQLSKLEIDLHNQMVACFFKIDSETKRPHGNEFRSSPIVGIEVVKDAHGNIHKGSEACIAIRTESDSVYLTVLDKTIINTIQRHVGKKKPRRKQARRAK
jgi:hypothetical protein